MTESVMSTQQMIAVSTRLQDERSGKIPHRLIGEAMGLASKSPSWTECHQALSSKILQNVAKSLKEHGMEVHFVDDREVVAENKRKSVLEVYVKGEHYAARFTADGGRTIFDDVVDNIDEVLQVARLS